MALPANFERFIVLVSPADAGEAAISFDFLSSQGEDAALQRARLSALVMFGDPERFVVVGIRVIDEAAGDEAVEAACGEIAAEWNAANS